LLTSVGKVNKKATSTASKPHLYSDTVISQQSTGWKEWEVKIF